MKLILLSPEEFVPGEAELVAHFFSLGLERYHLRKPGVTSIALGLWLSQLPAAQRAKIVLHQHHHLSSSMQITGLHWKDKEAGPTDPLAQPKAYPSLTYTSRACHEPELARKALGCFDGLLLSPIFDSLSKPALKASSKQWAPLLQEQSAARKRTLCFALGGITSDKLQQCKDLGFDGVAVLGAVWQSLNPQRAFRQLQEACLGLTTFARS